MRYRDELRMQLSHWFQAVHDGDRDTRPGPFPAPAEIDPTYTGATPTRQPPVPQTAVCAARLPFLYSPANCRAVSF
jgi:hypothetical protein